MMVDGERLKALLRRARRRVVLCAPFVKAKVLETLLGVVAEVVAVQVVTRWRPEEVAAGVSDLEVFEVVGARSGTELLLLDDLHAKLYVADDDCLVGSANLTASALGWAARSNVELLVSANVKDEEVEVLLEQLDAAETATFRTRTAVAAAAARLQTVTLGDGAGMEDDEGLRAAGWLPRCAAPERLYDIYVDEDTAAVAEETKEDGLADLKDLGVRRGLSRRAFGSAVAACLRRVPSMRGILKELPQGVADRRGAQLVSGIRPGLEDQDAEEHWRVVREWIGLFFGNEFEVAPQSFVTRLKPPKGAPGVGD